MMLHFKVTGRKKTRFTISDKCLFDFISQNGSRKDLRPTNLIIE